MKKSIPVLALCFATACGGSSMSTGSASFVASDPTSGAPSLPTSNDSSFQALLNDVRADAGADPVTYNAQLNQAAQDHAQDMLDNNYFSHTGLNGSTLVDRVNDTGYNWQTVGENIASGYQSEESVLDGWVNSPGHQANNVNPNFEEFGLGLAVDGNDTRWVLVLGAQQ